jgi:hypothetical protein
VLGSKRSAALIALALLTGLFVRLWGIGFAPTSPRARPDEEIFIQKAFERIVEPQGLSILRSGWPEGFFRIHYNLMRFEAAVLGLLWGEPVNMGCLYVLNPGAVELPSRLFSALCDLMTCVVIGLIVARLVPAANRRRALLLGILAYGCNYLSIRDAHFGVSDATLILCIALCLYYALHAALDRPTYLIAAGAAAGAGLGVKYSAVALAAPCLIAAAVALKRFPRRDRTLVICALAVLAAALALFFMSPSTMHLHELGRSLMAHRFRYGEEVRDQAMDSSMAPVGWWRFYFLEDLPAAFGVPGLILATVGLLAVLLTNPAAGGILLGSALATVSTLVGLQMLFTRYAAPMVPPLAVGLGYLLTQSIERLSELLPRRIAWPAFAVLLALALAPPLWTSLQFDRLLARPTTYDLASRWLLSKGTNVRAVSQGWYAQVQLLEPESEAACAAVVPPWLNPGVPEMPERGSHWPVAIEAGEMGWIFITNDGMNKYVFDLDEWEHADYVAVGRILLPCGKEAGPLQEHLPLDDGCFETVQLISPGKPSCTSKMDMFDYFAAPFSGFEGWESLGPRIEILKNLCKP